MSAAVAKKAKVEKPQLERLKLVRELLMGFKHVLDQELQPLGITSAQLRVLWMVSEHPEASGAAVARLSGMTPQSGHAMVAGMEELGWLRRHAGEKGGRPLQAEVTEQGRKILRQAKAIAERLDRRIWKGIAEDEIACMKRVLEQAIEQVGGER